MTLRHAPITDQEWSALLGPAADATVEGLIVQDVAGTIRATNVAARVMLGPSVDPSEDRLTGRGPRDPEFRLCHVDGRTMTDDERPGRTAVRSGVAQRDVRVLLRLAHVGERHLSINAVPLFAEGHDEAYGVVTSLVDITTVIETQATLAERERDLALLARHAGDLIARHDADGRIIYAAGGSEALLGVAPQQMVGFWAADVCHPDDAQTVRDAHELVRQGAATTVSYRVRHLVDGHELWLESTVQPIFGADGAFIEAVTTTRDISARKATEQRLRDAEEHALRQHELLAEAQDMAHLGSWAMDVRTGESWWSSGLFRIFGMAPTESPRYADHARCIHPEDVAAVTAALQQAADAGAPFEITYRVRRPDGAQRIMHGRGARADRDEDGRVRRIWGTTQDVTDLHALEAGRREAEARFRTAFEHAPIGISVVALRGDAVGQWLSVNPAMGEMLGWPREELIDEPLKSFIHPEDRWISRGSLVGLARGDQERISVECRLLHRDGTVLWTLVTAAAVRDTQGTPRHAVLQVVDITERKHVEGRLQHLADHDPLTGLLNRRRFEAELDRVLAEAERYGRPGALLVLDLDGFKYVNDTLGHRAGDELIARLSTTLRAELRESDVIARLGGDEFGVILPESSSEQAAAVADKLLRAVRRDGVVADDARHARVTASIGMAAFDGGDGLGAEELLVEADIAMYDAKEAGRNRATAHERVETGSGRNVSRLSWLERIRRALDEDRFELHAQPIVALAGDDEDEVPAFELLLRMRSDAGDLVPPATFLPIAERFDLIQAIDRWVVARAVRLLRREHADGRPVTLSVNVSGRTMGDAAFAGWLEALLTREPVPAQRLIVEITETAAIVNIESARALAETLRRLGCLLALDDFGAGFASFNYLKHLEFDVLKIDGEFVQGLNENPTDRLVVEAVVAIARGLGTPSLAEFVADSETLDAVRALGVDYAQGFHLGRPAPVEEALRAAQRELSR
jgi:diguanylate cyclase (GGDEF)-like protein/PAS domain S-box-containing protein